MSWLNHLAVVHLKLNVVEFVGKTAGRTMQLGHGLHRLLRGLSRLEIERHVFTVNVLVEVSVAGDSARLVNNFSRFLETLRGLDHLLGRRTCGLERSANLSWVLIDLARVLLLLGLALVGLFGRRSLLLVILIRLDRRLQLKRLNFRLASSTLVHVLVVLRLRDRLAELKVVGVVVVIMDGQVELFSESMELVHIHTMD